MDEEELARRDALTKMHAINSQIRKESNELEDKPSCKINHFISLIYGIILSIKTPFDFAVSRLNIQNLLVINEEMKGKKS